MNAPSIFSRMLLIVSALAVVGLSYWFIATSLAPIEVPPSAPVRGNVRFDPQADVTQHPKFSVLRSLGPALTVPSALGRQNPFVPPPPPPVAATSTVEAGQAQFVPTSTEQAIVPVPPINADTATSTP